jgi:hypothetical protein
VTALVLFAASGILLATVAALYHVNTKGISRIMSALDNVQTSEAALLARADALLAFAAAAKTQIAALQAAIDAAGNVDPALQSIADAMTAETAKIDAFLAPAPAPVTP